MLMKRLNNLLKVIHRKNNSKKKKIINSNKNHIWVNLKRCLSEVIY
jgi:hypothetical protein